MARELTRKKLKHDEFVEGVFNAEQWIEENWATVVKWVAGVVVVGLLVGGWIWWGRHQARGARNLLAEGLQKYSAAVVADDEEVGLGEAAALFEASASKGGSKPVGQVARYYRSAAMIRQDNPAGAIPLLEDLLASNPDASLGDPAQALLAKAYVEAGNAEQGIEAYRRLADRGTGYSEQALLRLGLLLAGEGRTSEATEALEELIDRFPNGPAAGVARRQLTALGEEG